MFERPTFRKNLVVEVVEPDQVFLFTETQQFVLLGKPYRAVAPWLDGTRTFTEVIEAVGTSVSVPEAMYALDQLGKKGYVVEGAGPEVSTDLAAWWETLGVRPARGVERLGAATVSLDAVGGADVSALTLVLRELGFTVGPFGAPDSVVVVVTDDYLRPGLREINERQLRRREPWLLAKLVGSTPWMGPLFDPETGPCWQCLAQRLDGNRQAEAYVQRNATSPEPIVTSIAQSPASVGFTTHLLATAIEQWIVRGEPLDAFNGTLRTYEVTDWDVTEHTVIRRPQCPACGEPELRDPDRDPAEVRLDPQIKRFTGDGGHRTARPEDTFARLEKHISPITGVISLLDRLTDESAELAHSYNAGHNFAMITDDLFFLRRNLRGMSGGKGMTEIQAKVSAMCEAVERWSGVWRGDEPRVQGSVVDLGDQVVPLRSLTNFSDQQYDTRKQWNEAQPDSRHHLVPEPLPEDHSIDWSPVWSLTKECRRLVPSAYTYFGHPDLKRLFFCTSDANGCAAGNTLEEAVLQGLLEAVERDATAVWWYNRVPRPALDLDSFGLPYVSRLQEYYATLGREFWVLDLTHDLGIPVCAAVSRRIDRQPEDVLIGLGAHVDPRTAMLRALTELNQFLPAVARTGADGTTEYWFPDTDAHEWWRTATVADEPWLLPAPDVPAVTEEAMPNLSSPDLAEDVKALVARLDQMDLETLILDQTRPDVDLRVVKVMVPGLRHFWRRLGPGRLYDVPVSLGWTDEPNDEASVNPWSIFF